MSEPKRYQPVVQCVEPSYQAQMIEPKVMEFSEGEYVLHSDYARLKAEVERLTKAGDVLYNSMMEIGCNEMADNFQHDAWFGSMKDWNAAKKGGQL